MSKYFRCDRCLWVYQDLECQCPESGAELCPRCYRNFGEYAAYEMEEVTVSHWHEKCWNSETMVWDIMRLDTWEAVAHLESTSAANRRTQELNKAVVTGVIR